MALVCRKCNISRLKTSTDVHKKGAVYYDEQGHPMGNAGYPLVTGILAFIFAPLIPIGFRILVLQFFKIDLKWLPIVLFLAWAAWHVYRGLKGIRTPLRPVYQDTLALGIGWIAGIVVVVGVYLSGISIPMTEAAAR